MNNKEKKIGGEQSKSVTAQHQLGTSMVRLLKSSEFKAVGGAGSVGGGRPPRSAGGH